MAKTKIEKYYERHNEDHRLSSRHGQVEFNTTMKYVHECVGNRENLRILDVGAGTGRYSVALAQENHIVTAVELVEKNRKILEAKHQKNVNIWPGNALDLSFLDDKTFDITLLFGPLYHLHTQAERLQVFSEAKRLTKDGGFILAAYLMNDYSIIEYCFKRHRIKSCLAGRSVDSDFHTISSANDLYSYLRLDDINELNERSSLRRIKIIAADGPADYMRRDLNAMDEEEFSLFLKYQLAVCERPELIGASSHTVDILQV